MNIREQITDNFMTIWFLMGASRSERRAHGRTNEDAQGLDPNKGRGRIIALLQLKDGLSTKELADILDIRVSSLNETLARLEGLGLVERKPSEADKRVMLVYLTDEGKKVDLGGEENDGLDLFKGFTDEELEQLEGYTARVAANAEGAFDQDFVDHIKSHWERRRDFMESLGGERPGGFDPTRPMPHFPGFGQLHDLFHRRSPRN